MATLTETIRDVEHKRRQLEENVDSLNEEVARFKASGKFSVYLLSLFKPVYSGLLQWLWLSLTCSESSATD